MKQYMVAKVRAGEVDEIVDTNEGSQDSPSFCQYTAQE